MCRREATHYRSCKHIITHRDQCPSAREATLRNNIPSKTHRGRLEKTWCHKPKSFESFDRCRECRKAHEARVRGQEARKAEKAREREERGENGDERWVKGFFKWLFGKKDRGPSSSCSGSGHGERGGVGPPFRRTHTQREHGQRIRNSTPYVVDQDGADRMVRGMNKIDARRESAFAHLNGGRPSTSQGLHRPQSAMAGGRAPLRGSSAAGSRRNDSSMTQWPWRLSEGR